MTGVAGTGVLATAFATYGWYPVAGVLLGVATLTWATVLGPVLRHWQTPTAGVSFLLTAGTEALAVPGAVLAARYDADWLLIGAVLAFGLGLVAYFATAWRFRLGQLLTEQGDEWVTGGALAISALAYVKIVAAGKAVGWLASVHGAFDFGALVLWSLAMLWLGPLVAAEVWRPRLTYDVRRWATVFPLGMYAACSFAVGETTGISGIVGFARAWSWLALVVGVLVLGGLARRIWHVLTSVGLTASALDPE